MHPDYIFLRISRRLIPSSIFSFLLKRNLFVESGPETSKPINTKIGYQEKLAQIGQSFVGKRILIFGYGSRFTLACMLLQEGATHVVLCDKYTKPDEQSNSLLLPDYDKYLVKDGHQVLPRSEYITLLHADIREMVGKPDFPQVDLVLSRSVFEHLDEVDATTRALVAITKPTGYHIHYINLSDHFFKYPYEMLTFSENTWRNWLNPPANLNRYRFLDYQRLFETYFANVQITVREHLSKDFEKARPRIRPEFLTGDPEIDSATKLVVLAFQPRSLSGDGHPC